MFVAQNEAHSNELLAAACAVGVSCNFAAPIGGETEHTHTHTLCMHALTHAHKYTYTYTHMHACGRSECINATIV